MPRKESESPSCIERLSDEDWGNLRKYAERVAKRAGVHPEEREDFAQDALAYALEKREKIRGSFEPYFTGVCSNRAKSFMRSDRRARDRVMVSHLEELDTRPGEQDLEEQLMVKRLYEVLEPKPEDTTGKRLLQLVLTDPRAMRKKGLNAQYLAETLGLSKSSIQATYRRAIEDLRSRF